MLNRIMFGLSALSMTLLVSSAVAYCPEGHGTPATTVAAKAEGEKKGGCAHAAGGECCKKKAQLAAATGTSEGSGGCPHAQKALARESKVEAVLTSLPSVKYRVGDADTCCSKAAAAMLTSAGPNAKMTYVVGEEAFDTEAAANVKLASLLEKQLADMQSMQFAAGSDCGRCPAHAKEVAAKTNSKIAYRVGGVDFAEQAQAEKALKLICEAASTVSMTCKAEGKAVDCKDGANVTYVVGDSETNSKDTATLLTLQAKIRKTVETAVATLEA